MREIVKENIDYNSLVTEYGRDTVDQITELMTEEMAAGKQDFPEQLDMFTDYEALARQRAAEERAIARERQGQQAVLDIRRRFGKNAILKGTSLMEGATGRERNRQIGGHRA